MEDREQMKFQDYIPTWRPQGVMMIKQLARPSSGLICFLSGLCSLLLFIAILLIVIITRQGVNQTEQSLEEKMRSVNETMNTKVEDLYAADAKLMVKMEAIKTSVKDLRDTNVTEKALEIKTLVRRILSEEVIGTLSSDLQRIMGVVGRLEEEIRHANSSADPLCEKDWKHFDSNCYYLSPRLRPWKEAKSDCQERKGQLVVINYKEEMEFLQELLHEQTAWIGLMLDGDIWKWVDKTPYKKDQTFWSEAQPNPRLPRDYWSDNSDECGAMRNEGWKNDFCSHNFYYICEKKR